MAANIAAISSELSGLLQRRALTPRAEFRVHNLTWKLARQEMAGSRAQLQRFGAQFSRRFPEQFSPDQFHPDRRFATAAAFAETQLTSPLHRGEDSALERFYAGRIARALDDYYRPELFSATVKCFATYGRARVQLIEFLKEFNEPSADRYWNLAEPRFWIVGCSGEPYRLMVRTDEFPEVGRDTDIITATADMPNQRLVIDAGLPHSLAMIKLPQLTEAFPLETPRWWSESSYRELVGALAHEQLSTFFHPYFHQQPGLIEVGIGYGNGEPRMEIVKIGRQVVKTAVAPRSNHRSIRFAHNPIRDHRGSVWGYYDAKTSTLMLPPLPGTTEPTQFSFIRDAGHPEPTPAWEASIGQFSIGRAPAIIMHL